METLLMEIRRWMSTNMLKLNDDKTEIIALEGPRRNRVELPPMIIGNEVIPVSKSVRLLGVDMDSNMTLKGHICCVAKKCFATLRNMFKIRRCLNETAAKAMVHTMVTSNIDYCNVLLCGLPQSTLKYLSKIQKISLRFISQSAKYGHVTPVLKDLHCLPIEQRIEYEVLVMNSLHNTSRN
ncbi:uncharacterized protein LOC116291926 [Actinia tenebrosa]|uniref:Uncharacterized protein LOC116291926 n=1 Tax=Actinia tenebrosa TaxID=6105 RepID=A0A6P8HQS2_ACTTE|nr:uncharacterized protein LOC116291926 [Actinia tenebrosa]